MNNELKTKDNVFKLIDKVSDFDLYIRNYVLCDIPKTYNDIRIHTLDELYNLVKNIKFSSITKGNIQNKYLTDTLVNISMIDYYFTCLIKLNLCNNKRIEKSLFKLAEIKNVCYSWYNKINEK